MKQIILIEYLKVKNKKYSVHLGNSSLTQFNTMRETKIFLRDTSSFLSDLLHESCLLFSEAYAHYRNLWFYMDSGNEIICFRHITAIENLLTQLTRPFTENGEYTCFVKFNRLLTEISELCMLLSSLIRRSPVQKINVQLIIRSCDRIKISLNEYAK